MLASADRAIVVADSSKFGKVSLSRLCGLHEVHAVVTDSSLDSKWKEHLALAGTEVVLAAPAGRPESEAITPNTPDWNSHSN